MALADRQKRAKTRFALSVELVDKHYASCAECRTAARPCARARGYWDGASEAFADVVRTCGEWHHARFQGAERGRVLTRKLRRVLALLLRPPRG